MWSGVEINKMNKLANLPASFITKMLGFFFTISSSAVFSRSSFFRKLLSGIRSECQTVKRRVGSGSKLFAKVISTRH